MIQRLGWALLHFLWQGTAIVIVFAILRKLLARSLRAQGRYVLGCVALGAMTVAPALTFLMVPVAAPQISWWSVSASDWQRLLPAVVALWLLGVLVFSLRLLGAWRFTARLRSTAHPAPAEWQQTVDRIAARVGARRHVRLLVSLMVDVPTVIGWLRPAVLVPVEFFTGVPVEHIKALLAHEIAHIRRIDYLASMLQSIAEAVLFYHPAVWWISEQIRAERELCCDDIAVTVGGDVLVYARALAELEARQPSLLKTALAANGGSLVNRIRRLIEPESVPERGNNLPGPGAMWSMILLWIAGVGVSAAHAAQTPVVVPLSPEPLPQLVNRARNTLLFDPFVSAQLSSRGDGPATKPQAPALSPTGRIRFEDVPQPPEAPHPPAISGPAIEDIEFQGARRIPQATLKAIIASRAGGVYDIEALRRDSQYLYNTGRFSDVVLETEPGSQGVVVRFVVVERPLIRSIEYQGDDTVTVPEILERFRQRNIRLRAETLYNEDELGRAAATVHELVAERGRQNIKVTPLVEQIQTPSTVKITFRVENMQ